MTNLTTQEQNDLWNLKNKLSYRQASSSDMRRFIQLIQKSSNFNKIELENYVRSIGYNSIQDFQNDLIEKNKEELINAIVIIGGAVLIGLALTKLFERG